MKTLLTNAKVYVQKDTFAQAILVEDDKILYVGDEATAKTQGGAIDRTIDCQGKTVIPGLNDNHNHPMVAADYNRYLDLAGCKSLEEVVARGKAYAADPDHAGKPIQGVNWNENLFSEGPIKPPTKVEANAISTDVPVVLIDYTEHVAVGNTKAMEMIGVRKGAIPKVDGGVILTDKNGEPNGHFQENARRLLMELIAEVDTKEMEGLLSDFIAYANSFGVTSLQGNDVGMIWTPQKVHDFYHHWRDTGKLNVRYHTQNYFMTIPEMEEYWEGERKTGRYDDFLTPGPLKLFKDGTIGSRTAWMSVAFEDDPGNFGESVETNEQLLAQSKWANERGWQVITHAIGDQAIRDMTEIYIEAGGFDKTNPCRNIMNHCQLMTPDMIDRMAEYNILAACQPIFLHSDMHSLETRITCEMAHTSNCYKTQIEKMVNVSFGTDCPVEDINPWRSVYSAVVRKDLDGYPEGGYFADERVDVATAIDSYTYASAYQQFMEDRKGRLAAGQFADLAVLDRDIFTCDPMELKDVTSDLTMVEGRIVHEK